MKAKQYDSSQNQQRQLTWLRFSGGKEGSPSCKIKRVTQQKSSNIIIMLHYALTAASDGTNKRQILCMWTHNISFELWATHNKFPVLFLESLVTLPQLVGHQLVLVSLLLTRIQLLGQNEQGFLLTLQLAFTHQELQQKANTRTERRAVA